MAKLEEYNRKRDFARTSEPEGKTASTDSTLRFVVQRHDASRLHYDFRLEYDGVLWSWAVPKGPSFNPRDKRLAVMVEDHPLEYRHFEGTIPEGEYGGGTVQLFDEGYWIPEGNPMDDLQKGSLKFTLEGNRLKGRWTLIRMKPRAGEEDKNWLLIKEKDSYVQTEDGVTSILTSVRSGRTLEEIAAQDPSVTPSPATKGLSAEGTGKNPKPEAKQPKDSTKTKSKADQSAAPKKKKPTNDNKTSKEKTASAARSNEKQTTTEKEVTKNHKSAKLKAASDSTTSNDAKASDQKDQSKDMEIDKDKDKEMDREISEQTPLHSLPFHEVKPMLAVLTKKVPQGSEWIHELKFDGYRILAVIENRTARLLTRNGLDWSKKAPELTEALAGWAPDNLILDGELVVFDSKGKSDFQALQSYFKTPGSKSLDYVVFDLLAQGSEDLRGIPLLERKSRLETLLKNAPEGIHYSYHTEGGSKVFGQACDEALEGIISKKKASLYRGTRSMDWLKVKCTNRREFVIGGYTVSDKNTSGISSLLLGYYQKDQLIYSGRAGTGFHQKNTQELLAQFRHLQRKTSPFTNTPESRTGEYFYFLKPELVADIQFAELTDDGLLRQASYKGLRLDKAASQVTPEVTVSEPVMERDLPEPPSKRKTKSRPVSSSAPKNPLGSRESSDVSQSKDSFDVSQSKDSSHKSQSKESLRASRPKNKDTAAAGSASASRNSDSVEYDGVTLSSPDKVLFPEDQITKQDVADYYWSVREYILPYLISRPMTLIRCPEQIGEDCFFQKHQTHPIPGMDTVTVPDNDGDETQVMIMNDTTSLMGAVQMGALEFHGWGSQLDHLEQPDWLVFDLDPAEGLGAEKVRQGVRDLKTLLDEMNLQAYLKTSGGKGYHIVIPLVPSADWEAVRAFAKLMAQGMEARWPDRYTANMRKDKRKDRIYVDWVRNGRSATSVSIFSLRARKGAPISWPIGWADLDQFDPATVTIRNWQEYTDTIQEWADFFQTSQKLK